MLANLGSPTADYSTDFFVSVTAASANRTGTATNADCRRHESLPREASKLAGVTCARGKPGLFVHARAREHMEKTQGIGAPS